MRLFGSGGLSELGQFAHELGGHRVLIVSDGGVIQAGHSGRAMDALSEAGLTVHLFAGVQENPTTATVDAGVVVDKIVIDFGDPAPSYDGPAETRLR